MIQAKGKWDWSLSEDGTVDWRFELAFEDAVDPNSGRSDRSWVFVLPIGETVHVRGRKLELTEEYVRGIAAETRRAYAVFDQEARGIDGEPYRFPIWRDHKPSSDREGDVLSVKVMDKMGRYGLWVELGYTDATLEGIENNNIKHVSAGIRHAYDHSDGQTFGPVIREVSLTADPVLKGIGTIQDTWSVSLSQDAITELSQLGDEDMEELLEQLRKQGERMDALQKTQAELLKLSGKRDDDGDESKLSTGADDEDDDGDEDVDGDGKVEGDEDGDDKGENLSKSEKAFLDRANAVLDKIDVKLSKAEDTTDELGQRLNTRERGHQGGGETREDVHLSYDAKIEAIKKKHGVDHLEAVEMEIRNS